MDTVFKLTTIYNILDITRHRRVLDFSRCRFLERYLNSTTGNKVAEHIALYSKSIVRLVTKALRLVSVYRLLTGALL